MMRDKLNDAKMKGKMNQEVSAAAAAERISILIADDHKIVREGLVSLISLEPDFEVVAQAADGAEAVRLFDRLRPCVSLIDLNMPVLDGLETIAAISRLAPQAKTIVLTTFDGDEDIYRALRAGASGYLLKDVLPDILLEAIRKVARGKMNIAPDLMQKLAERIHGNDLTPREAEILNLIVDGKSNQEITHALAIADSTLKFHINHIFGKLGVNDRTKAVVVAVRRGLARL